MSESAHDVLLCELDKKRNDELVAIRVGDLRNLLQTEQHSWALRRKLGELWQDFNVIRQDYL